MLGWGGVGTGSGEDGMEYERGDGYFLLFGDFEIGFCGWCEAILYV